MRSAARTRSSSWRPTTHRRNWRALGSWILLTSKLRAALTSARRDNHDCARVSMRAASVISEAWRNASSGTTRAAVLAVVMMLSIGSLAVSDARAVVSVVRAAAEFRAAGAAIQILDAPGHIDAARCQKLGEVDGILAAGATRAAARTHFVTLPDNDVASFDVTPGLAGVLGVQTEDPGGVWLSSDLATDLGAHSKEKLMTGLGLEVVSGTYAFPEDGRDRILAYAQLAPVPAEGVFDACWVEVWPTSTAASALLRTALVPLSDSGVVPKQRQLNSTLGASFNASNLLANRATRQVPVAIMIAGLALGYVSVRLRRLELASALHARVGRAALLWQIILETGFWATAGTALLAPALWWSSQSGITADGQAVWFGALRHVATGWWSILAGASCACLLARERHLFRYFKQR